MAPATKRKQSGPAVPNGYKEDSSKGPMLRYEDSLPRLPVPTLEETAKRYLKSCHAVLKPHEYKVTEAAVAEFIKPGGQGEVLQKRLLARRDGHKNWLYEWWNSHAYLSDRGPVVPYVSYFYSHRDDRRRRDPAKRAAALTTAALEFKKMVDMGSLEPEYMRKEPIAMSSYHWMFNTCRVPSETEDYPVKYSFTEHPYIIAMRKNQFFKIEHEVAGRQLNTSELEQQFRRVYKMAKKSPAVGVLTAERRSEWAKMRKNLIANPANKAALQAIEASSFIVCLDDASPITLEERATQYWHGDGCNRWFDKPCQFIINDNGTSGFMGEHSMMDGTPTNRLNNYTQEVIFKNKLDFNNSTVRTDLPDPSPLRFVITPTVQRDISSAYAFHEATIAAHELRVQAYQGYGSGMIKKLKCSPDAYVQMIIQLAYYKMYGISRPTYESVAMRRFQQGRTETCRSTSDASTTFCSAMENPEVSSEKCAELLRAALKEHGAYVSNASAGKGVDRHLFGLKKLVKEEEELPALFKDPAYAYSCHWFLSTSQLSSEYFNGWGFSQVVDGGWGFGYMINENSIQFNVVSKGLGCDRMSFFLSEAASEMRDIMLPTLDAPKAKL